MSDRALLAAARLRRRTTDPGAGPAQFYGALDALLGATQGEGLAIVVLELGPIFENHRAEDDDAMRGLSALVLSRLRAALDPCALSCALRPGRFALALPFADEASLQVELVRLTEQLQGPMGLSEKRLLCVPRVGVALREQIHVSGRRLVQRASQVLRDRRRASRLLEVYGEEHEEHGRQQEQASRFFAPAAAGWRASSVVGPGLSSHQYRACELSSLPGGGARRRAATFPHGAY